MFCDNCGAELAENARFCTSCGSQIEQPEFVPVAEPVSQEMPASVPVPVEQPAYSQVAAPLAGGIANWKTSAGMTALGVVAAAVINGFVGGFDSTIALIVDLAYVIASIWYALSMYPKYFKNRSVDSASTTSFLNGLFGGIIFGCLWNSNLTKGKKGVSNIVFACVVGAGIVLGFIAGLAA